MLGPFHCFADFDSSGTPDNIGFVIKKIKIWNDPTVAGYKYDGNFAVDYFLDLHSDYNYDDYCLSYLFTYRDFSDGVLGLAWVGDLNSAGGVCEIYRVGKIANLHLMLNRVNSDSSGIFRRADHVRDDATKYSNTQDHGEKSHD